MNQENPQHNPPQNPWPGIDSPGPGEQAQPQQQPEQFAGYEQNPIPGASGNEMMPENWQAAADQASQADYAGAHAAGSFVPDVASGKGTADDKLKPAWEGDADEALPEIHDDRLGSKTFVPNVALELYEIAAQQGDAQAQYSLGLCYHYGEGTLKDPNKAFAWFKEAAQEGHAEAQYSLGVYYQLGVGTPADPESAFKWFEQAAIQNQAKAQHELGESYFHGRGVTKDPAQAKKWINKSYINGNKLASQSWERYQLWKY